jgi:hypothetical protein
MKKSKFSFDEWKKAIEESLHQGNIVPPGNLHGTTRRWDAEKDERHPRVEVAVGDVVHVEEGSSYFGSGGYSGACVWASPSGECPVASPPPSMDNGCVSGRAGLVQFVRPGIVYYNAGDCIGEGRNWSACYVCREVER